MLKMSLYQNLFNQQKSILVLSLVAFSSSVFAAKYTQGTIDLTPVILGMGDYTGGYFTTDAVINGLSINTYKAANGFVVTEIEKMTRGYSAELGYFIFDNVQLLTRVSYIEQKGLGATLSIYPRAYEFNSRTSWGFSLGIDRYFNTKSENWVPFIGIMGGVVFQEETVATVYGINTGGSITTNYGSAVFQPSKRRFKASFDVGADYKFNDRWAVGIATGISYLNRLAPSHSHIFGLETTYQNNEKSFTIPFYVSIRNLIPKTPPWVQCQMQKNAATQPSPAAPTTQPPVEQKTDEQKAAEQKAAEEKIAKEKEANEKATAAKMAELKATAEKALAEKATAEKALAEKLAAEKALAEKTAAEQKVAQEKADAEKAAAELKEAEDKAAEEKAAAEKDKSAMKNIKSKIGKLFGKIKPT